MVQCKCKTLTGHKCARDADPDSPVKYCWQHQQDEGWVQRCNSLRRRGINANRPPRTSVVAASLPMSGGRRRSRKRSSRRRSRRRSSRRRHSRRRSSSRKRRSSRRRRSRRRSHSRRRRSSRKRSSRRRSRRSRRRSKH